MEARSYVATEIDGASAPIQRSHAPNPATARRSGMCSRSYQSWNSSACAPEKSNTASSRPLAIGSLPKPAPCSLDAVCVNGPARAHRALQKAKLDKLLGRLEA